MAVFIDLKANVRIFEDAAKKNCLFALDDKLSEVAITNMDRMISGVRSIAANTTESVGVGDITVPRGIFIRSDLDVDLNIDFGSGVQVIPLRKAAASVAGAPTYARILLETTFATLTITNPDLTLAANVLFAFWGDPQ